MFRRGKKVLSVVCTSAAHFRLRLPHVSVQPRGDVLLLLLGGVVHSGEGQPCRRGRRARHFWIRWGSL